jgi:hypothetical protein
MLRISIVLYVTLTGGILIWQYGWTKEKKEEIIEYASKVSGYSASELSISSKEVEPVIIISIKHNLGKEKLLAHPILEEVFSYDGGIRMSFSWLNNEYVERGNEIFAIKSDFSCFKSKPIKECVDEEELKEVAAIIMEPKGEIKKNKEEWLKMNYSFEYPDIYFYNIKTQRAIGLQGFTVYVSKDGEILGNGEAEVLVQ